MTWIYDQQTEYSRLMVGYDRWGITIREWSDELPGDDESGYSFQEAFFTWSQFRHRKPCYSGDDGSGPLKRRMVTGAISLLGYWGGNSDDCGVVPDLDTYLNGYREFSC